MAFFPDSTPARPNFARGSQTSAPTTPAAPRQAKTNGYGAKCATCGGWVPERTGTLSKVHDQWVVRHIQPCPTESTAKPATFAVPDGRYTVVFPDGYKTIRVRHQDEFDSFMPGKVVLSYLSGANNDADYTSFAHVTDGGEVRVWKKHQDNARLREAVKVLLGDPKAASQAYAAESGCCGICNRTLTTPDSIAAGIGPECAKRVSW